MAEYNENAKCPKCGCIIVKSQYTAPRPYAPGYDADQKLGEHIRRQCSRCYYAWNEDVLKKEADRG